MARKGPEEGFTLLQAAFAQHIGTGGCFAALCADVEPPT